MLIYITLLILGEKGVEKCKQWDDNINLKKF